MQLKKQQEVVHQALEAVMSPDPIRTARSAGLRYVTDCDPGIQRRKVGRGFTYLDVNGDRIRTSDELERFKALRIPPAWQDVWICTDSDGHLQATGRDEKGRKQYIYHPNWCKLRNQAKFDRMIPFGLALPLIRYQTDRHLKERTLSRERVLALVVRLLEETLIRVGNVEYAKQNRSYGLTTLRTRHVKITSTKVRFEFRGKRGVEHEIEVSDRRLVRAVKRCQELPGYELFQYIDDEGQRQTVDSGDVNDYLREITGEDFTAKEFRTWAGTVQAALVLKEIGPFSSETEAKRNVTQAVKQVAQRLGNRPATCRKYYIHPVILEAYQNGELLTALEENTPSEPIDPEHGLDVDELAVLAFLDQHRVEQ